MWEARVRGKRDGGYRKEEKGDGGSGRGKRQDRRGADTPKMPALTKCRRLKYSSKSFWIGVPDRRILF